MSGGAKCLSYLDNRDEERRGIQRSFVPSSAGAGRTNQEPNLLPHNFVLENNKDNKYISLMFFRENMAECKAQHAAAPPQRAVAPANLNGIYAFKRVRQHKIHQALLIRFGIKRTVLVC